MKKQFEFRDAQMTKKIIEKIQTLMKNNNITLMHVCGTHEHTIASFGLRSLLPSELEVIAGPGCPVCVCPSHDIDIAIALAKIGMKILTFGDMLRVPSTKFTLMQANAMYGNIKMVYSPRDAIEFAQTHPDKKIIFFAVGFETSAPPLAHELLNDPPSNFKTLCSYRLIPPAVELLLGSGEVYLDGMVLPGHVCSIIGTKAFQSLARAYHMPMCVAGFEPLDVLMAIVFLLRQLRDDKAFVENEYFRVVKEEGNVEAQKKLNLVFEVATVQWRGIGQIPDSGYTLKTQFEDYDARKIYEDILPQNKSRDILPGCHCHLVILGKIRPQECKLFKKICTPEKPKGPCMVSYEGSCRIQYDIGDIVL
ncbi:MAG: hydrogenase formation protein HypD [Promethearchaeota archaeon]